MQTSNVFPFHLRWSADELAAAVPLRLSELALFDGATLHDSANAHRDNGAALAPAAARRMRLQAYSTQAPIDGLFHPLIAAPSAPLRITASNTSLPSLPAIPRHR